MTVTAIPFKAVLLACPNGHHEATTEEAVRIVSNLSVCARCSFPLALVKTVTIWPGGETMIERPTFPWNDGISLTTGENRGIFLALGAVFELLVQIADALDAIERG